MPGPGAVTTLEGASSGNGPGPVLDVLVVGAGITGIYQLHRALQAGFVAGLWEAGDGVGGTWFWNRYPGARFDSESYTYAYLFSKELFEQWQWSELFAGQPEIERYLNHVVDRFDLRRHMQMGARVRRAVFDEASGTWTVTAADGRRATARFLVAATGVLSVPFFPEVPGRERFGGESYHTGSWPSLPVDFSGKRVAVIGTGSSGVQLVPAVAEQAASLTVYQRTPNWCTPLNNAPIGAEEQARLRAEFDSIKEILDTSPAGFLHQPCDRASSDDPPEARRAYFEKMWNSPGFSKLISHYTDVLFDEGANAEWCAFIASKVRAVVKDPATAEKLVPKDHRFGEKRPPFVSGYYEAFNRPNVSLVDLQATPMLRMTEAGIETADGLRPFDMVVWATGFDFGTGALLRMDLVGRGGLRLADHWAEGPKTFLGIQSAGFPNLFFPGGPHAAAGNNPRYNGDQVDFVTDTLVYLRAARWGVIEVDHGAEKRWTAMVDRGAAKSSFGEISYYFGTNIPGKPKKYLLNSGGRPKLASMVAEVVSSDYQAFRLSRPPALSAAAAAPAPDSAPAPAPASAPAPARS